MKCISCQTPYNDPIPETDLGKNYCPECGKRQRKLPLVAVPPNWELFTISITRPPESERAVGIANSPHWDKKWRFEVEGNITDIEKLLKDKWELACKRASEKNAEITEINKQHLRVL